MQRYSQGNGLYSLYQSLIVYMFFDVIDPYLAGCFWGRHYRFWGCHYVIWGLGYRFWGRHYEISTRREWHIPRQILVLLFPFFGAAIPEPR